MGRWRLRSPLATITLPCSGTDSDARATDGANDARQKRSFLRGLPGRRGERGARLNDRAKESHAGLCTAAMAGLLYES